MASIFEIKVQSCRPVIVVVRRHYKPHAGPFSQIARKSFPQQHRPKSVWEFQQ